MAMRGWRYYTLSVSLSSAAVGLTCQPSESTCAAVNAIATKLLGTSVPGLSTDKIMSHSSKATDR